MFWIVNKSLHQIRTWCSTHSYCLQKQTSQSLDSVFQSSFTVDYLMNSCGLSAEAARTAAKKYLFKTPENPNSVLVFFTKQGFTKAQISNIVSRIPSLLALNVERILKPKIQILLDLGFSLSQVTKLIVANPTILKYSLKNHIEPSISFLKELLGSDEKTVAAIGRSPRLLTFKLSKIAGKNISLLQNEGVPFSDVLYTLYGCPSVINQNTDQLKEIVMNVKGLGLDTCTPCLFMDAIRTLYSNKTKLDSKSNVYKSLGWSEMEILSAFRKRPSCMMLSEDRIRSSMDFFVNKLNMKPSDVSFSPILLLYSLERRIIPRCTVLQFLAYNNVLQQDLNPLMIRSSLKMSEKRFLEKYVIMHQDKVPDVLDAYLGKIGFTGLNFVVQK